MSYRESRILVTGANGFLGTRLTDILFKRDYAFVYELRGKSELNLTQEEKVDKFIGCGDYDVIIHLAGDVGGIGANQKYPGRFFYNNMMMGMNLIEAARKYDVSKFIMVGTVCSYPKFTDVPFKEDDLWNGFPEETNAPYGIAKKALMEMLRAYKLQYGLESVNLLPANMYGPGDNFHPMYSHVIPAIIMKVDDAKKNGKQNIRLWGTGAPTREFLYVDDCCDAIIEAMENVETCEPMNVGTGTETSIKEVAELIKYVMGYEGNIIWETDKPDGQPRRSLCVDKIREKMGWVSSTTLMDGITKTVEWFHKERNN